MAGGRPTEALPLAYSPDMTCGLRGKWRGVPEAEWCAFAMGRQSDWMPVLAKDNFDRYDLEYQVPTSRSKTRKTGMPRFDAVGWRGNRASIIEAKIEMTPSAVMGGVGQLLYYHEAAKRLLGWDIEELILLTPAWPAFLVDALERFSLPISLLQVTPDNIYGRSASVASN